MIGLLTIWDLRIYLFFSCFLTGIHDNVNWIMFGHGESGQDGAIMATLPPLLPEIGQASSATETHFLH